VPERERRVELRDNWLSTGRALLGGPSGEEARIRTRIGGDKRYLEMECNPKDNNRPGADDGCTTEIFEK